jgi:hypothetical protein
MDVAQVLAHLQAQYSGQLVLYVEDIAKLLGKSQKAISNLIARKGLPFKIKMVGGRRCVDVFQVAQWLCSDAEVTEEVVGPVGARAIQNKREKQGAGRGLTAQHAGTEQKTSGLMAAQILQMRHDYAAPLERFVSGLRNPDELEFMYEVLRCLFYSGDSLASSYVVTIRKFSPSGFKVLGEETAKYFDSKERACIFLVSRLEHTKYAKDKRHLVHFVFTHLNDTLFHAVATAGSLVVLNSAIHVDLPGL